MGIIAKVINDGLPKEQKGYEVQILDYIRRNEGEVTKSQIYQAYGRNDKKRALDKVLIEMEAMGVISGRIEKSRTKPGLIIYLSSDDSIIEYAYRHYDLKA